jgi:hypothetical protein
MSHARTYNPWQSSTIHRDDSLPMSKLDYVMRFTETLCRQLPLSGVIMLATQSTFTNTLSMQCSPTA